MAKLVLSMFISLDGYIEGPNAEFVGPEWSDDLEQHWSGYALARAGRLLYGRVCFEGMKAFWGAAETDPESPAASIAYTPTMNSLPKTVVSHTLTGDPGWNGTVLRDDLADAVAHLKATEPRDVYSFGGAGLANSLVTLDLPDEYRLMVTPNLLGDGKRLFDPGLPRFPLTLLEAKPLDTGAVILHYRRDRNA